MRYHLGTDFSIFDMRIINSWMTLPALQVLEIPLSLSVNNFSIWKIKLTLIQFRWLLLNLTWLIIKLILYWRDVWIFILRNVLIVEVLLALSLSVVLHLLWERREWLLLLLDHLGYSLLYVLVCIIMVRVLCLI